MLVTLRLVSKGLNVQHKMETVSFFFSCKFQTVGDHYSNSLNL